MIVRLLRDTKVWHKAGEIVKVSPAEGQFLISVGSARAEAEAKAEQKPEKPVEKKTTKKKAKKADETPDSHPES